MYATIQVRDNNTGQGTGAPGSYAGVDPIQRGIGVTVRSSSRSSEHPHVNFGQVLLTALQKPPSLKTHDWRIGVNNLWTTRLWPVALKQGLVLPTSKQYGRPYSPLKCDALAQRHPLRRGDGVNLGVVSIGGTQHLHNNSSSKRGQKRSTMAIPSERRPSLVVIPAIS